MKSITFIELLERIQNENAPKRIMVYGRNSEMMFGWSEDVKGYFMCKETEDGSYDIDGQYPMEERIFGIWRRSFTEMLKLKVVILED